MHFVVGKEEISLVDSGKEKIILSIEFCSALQAGNQAWQRSARAFSVGRTGCPYLYIVDFVKYELDNNTRKRKNLRFPNAAVPYSYVNYSKNTGNFIAQLYIKSEEFDRNKDTSISDFDESNFGLTDLKNYIVKRMMKIDTKQNEEEILQKNMNVVKFLSDRLDEKTNFTSEEWEKIYNLSDHSVVDCSIQTRRFNFHKTVAESSLHGNLAKLISVVDKLSIGLASKDLPFGIIPADLRPDFAKVLKQLYPNADSAILNTIADTNKNIVIAIFKGFKPRGDDNRPDRGLIPLASMLSNTNVDIMTYLYGPIIEANLKLLNETPLELAKRNGLWKSIIALSNFLILDSPVIAKKPYDVQNIYDTTQIKNHFMNPRNYHIMEPSPTVSITPTIFGEDDVDTAIHYLFSHVLSKTCFEGMCNPPGGDWSGFSVIDGGYEYRWLSLPRVSDIIDGKRPDHILELFNIFTKPLLLSIESKEKSRDLEKDVGLKLIAYIEKLLKFIPSSKRKISPQDQIWEWGEKSVDINHFEIISAAAYLKQYAEPNKEVLKKKCEILFILNPVLKTGIAKWELEIVCASERALKIKNFIIHQYNLSGNKEFVIK